ncbi:MAG TPA: VWA domain-containing protein [Thermoanaerobaculia bacterium]
MKSLPRCTRRSLPLLAALAALVAGGGLVAQEFAERQEVVVVEVPVNVTDRDGEPVRGLTADDFEVYDEGKLQKLTGAEIVDLQVLSSEKSAQVVQQLPSTQRRHFLLLFDLSFATPSAILRARLAARDFVLESLHPADLAAVATFSLEDGPRLIVTFTPDRAQLARAIDTLGVRSKDALAGLHLDPLRFLITAPEIRTNPEGRESESRVDVRLNAEGEMLEHLTIIMQQMDRNQRQFDRSRITAYARSLGDVARSLDSVRGRKHVVLFSEGFDSRLLIGRQPESQDEEQQRDLINAQRGALHLVDSDQMYGNVGLLNDLEKMVEQFRRADCVIQAVDIGGLRAGSEVRPTAANAGQDSLFLMANPTGGELFKDANDLGRQLDRVLQRSAVTYVLTFQPSELKLDGAYRKLRVKLKNETRGLHLAHRAGYYRPRPFQDLDPLEKQLLASDAIASAAPADGLAIEVLAAAFRASKGSSYVPVIVEIDGPSLLAGHDSEKLAVEIYAYVTDAKGEMRDFFTQMVGLDVGKNRQALARSGLKYYGHLELGPGDYRIRVLVRNGRSGRTAVESIPLTIPPYDSSQAIVLPPFFVEPPGRWILVREQSREQSVVYPFTVNGEPYIPAVKPALRGEDASRFCLVAYNLPAGELELEGRVIAADGREIPGARLQLVERTVTGISRLDKLLATFKPGGLEAGEYHLQVAVRQPGNGPLSSSSIPFSVVN